MDDTQLILSALKQPSPKSRLRKKVLRDLGEMSTLGDPSPIEEKDDVITAISKRTQRKSKYARKSVNEWGNTDFVSYLRHSLSNHGIGLEPSGVNGLSVISKIHDRLVDKLECEMSNQILKEFIDWWVSSHAQCLGSSRCSVLLLGSERFVDRFATRFAEVDEDMKCQRTLEEGVVCYTNVTPETIYNLGGLPMLLCSFGIVDAHKLLKTKENGSGFTKIASALRELSKDDVKQVMKVTQERSPYHKNDVVDFISVAKAALEFHGLNEFKNVSYQKFFS